MEKQQRDNASALLQTLILGEREKRVYTDHLQELKCEPTPSVPDKEVYSKLSQILESLDLGHLYPNFLENGFDEGLNHKLDEELLSLTYDDLFELGVDNDKDIYHLLYEFSLENPLKKKNEKLKKKLQEYVQKLKFLEKLFKEQEEKTIIDGSNIKLLHSMLHNNSLHALTGSQYPPQDDGLLGSILEGSDERSRSLSASAGEYVPSISMRTSRSPHNL